MKNINKMTLDEMNIEIERLAKRANTRIRALEVSSDPETDFPLYQARTLSLEGATNWTQGRPRFSRSKATTVASARARLKNVRKFLKMKSTTATGRKQIRNARFEAFKDKYNFNGSESDYKKLISVLNTVEYFRDSQEIIDLANAVISREGNLPSGDVLIKYMKRNPVDPVTVYEENTIDWSEYQI